MGNEIELKLEVAPEDTERLKRSWLEPAECSSQRQLSVYFDTPDNAVRECGYTLRVRSVGERYIQTVKGLEGGAGLFDRGEWEYQIDGPLPDLGKLASTPLASLELERLRPIVWTDVNRTACRLTPDGAVIELDVDEGVMAAAGQEMPVCELEIEMLHGNASSAVELARRIAADVPVKLSVLSKAERGFALAEDSVAKVTKAEPVVVRPGMTVAEGFQTIVTACIRHFRLNEPIVIERREAESLHQARVAMRRLRSALTLFRPAIADEPFERIRDELRWFTAELGDARNLDVFLERDLPDGERERLKRKRECAYASVITAMESPRFRLLVLDIVSWAALGEWRQKEEAKGPLKRFTDGRIDRLWKRISHAKKLSAMDDAERHHLRIQAKKLRYALEFTAELHADQDKKQKKFAKAIEDIQESLGYFHDIIVARTVLAVKNWPIDPQQGREEERGHLRDARKSLKRLSKIGPYWRSKAA
jgi:inorganic triphosphatase YgiF